MSVGRLISFAIFIVVTGLLQLWALVLVKFASGSPVQLAELLGDGGLFFFSTSLATGSAMTLFDDRPPRFGSTDFNVTCVLCGAVLLSAVTYYVTVLATSGGRNAIPFAPHLLPQLACAFAALVYWYFVGVRTGAFAPRVDDAA